jgi:23S rRNA pseudouridine2605 synthase
MVRLQRVLADAGVAARRVCEKLIEEGRVEVNGELVTKLPAFVDPRTDKVSVDGKPIAKPVGGPTGRKLYIILHKPDRTLTTATDEPGLERRTVLDLIDHPAKPRLFPVGRLGWDETGLVLLTNDGELANRLTHPRYGVPKTYLAVVKGDVDETDLHRFSHQMFKLERLASRQEGRIKSSHVDMAVFKREPGKTTLRVTMKEGKNRYVAEVLGQSGFPVRKVAAVAIGPLQLRGLPIGSWRELTRDEIRLLRAACKDDATPEMKSGIKPDSEDEQNLRVPRQWAPRRESPSRGRPSGPASEGAAPRGTRGTRPRQGRSEGESEGTSDDRSARPGRPPETPKQVLPSNAAARTIRPPKPAHGPAVGPADGPVARTGAGKDSANSPSAGVYIPPSRRERMKAKYDQVREARSSKPAVRGSGNRASTGSDRVRGGPGGGRRPDGNPSSGFGSPRPRMSGGGGGGGGGVGERGGMRGQARGPARGADRGTNRGSGSPDGGRSGRAGILTRGPGGTRSGRDGDRPHAGSGSRGGRGGHEGHGGRGRGEGGPQGSGGPGERGGGGGRSGSGGGSRGGGGRPQGRTRPRNDR